jgi:mRNA interferase RelE/StbE
MTYSLQINRQAKKTLQSLSRPERIRITEKIMQLGVDPDDSRLDIKALQGQPYFRLRVGQWRIIFDRNDSVKIISIQKIKPRGDAYK